MAIQPEILARLPQAPTRAELIAKSRATKLVVLPPPPPPKPTAKSQMHTCGGVLFVLESGDTYCLNCGEL